MGNVCVCSSLHSVLSSREHRPKLQVIPINGVSAVQPDPYSDKKPRVKMKTNGSVGIYFKLCVVTWYSVVMRLLFKHSAICKTINSVAFFSFFCASACGTKIIRAGDWFDSVSSTYIAGKATSIILDCMSTYMHWPKPG